MKSTTLTQVNLSLNKLISPDGQELRDAKYYFETFEILPVFLLNSYGIRIDQADGELCTLVEMYLYTYKTISQWINCFKNSKGNNIDNNIFYLELYFSDKKHLKSRAEFSWAMFNLCEEILKVDLWGWKESFEFISPAKLWFSSEYEKLENTFLQNGILGKFEKKGKREVCDSTRKQIKKDLEGFYNKEFFSPSPANCSQANNVITSTSINIQHHAEAIAQQNQKFSLLYQEGYKTKLRFYRDFRNDGNLQSAGLKNNGSIHITGKGKRGQDTKKRQKKSFSKEI
ncbi:MAG: hypothetical protein QNJ53_04090 [Pleurocapsa sp. MO_192.B19]|nr:hypothetical protein [Pleurocapsa sp. MO_192.B19]